MESVTLSGPPEDSSFDATNYIICQKSAGDKTPPDMLVGYREYWDIMNVTTPMKLGQSTSLLNGYKADLCPAQPFYTSSKPALYEQQVIVESPDPNAKWSSPMISLHENVEDLLSAIQQIKLRSMSFEDTASEGGAAAVWPAGALLLAGLTPSARRKAITDLSEQLGLDLATEHWSYVLVRRSRKVGTATHPCYQRGIFGNPDPSITLRPETLTALKSLEKLKKESTDVSMAGAHGYLSFYETFGSHFVSSVDAGDLIFQVFAYAEADYKKLVNVYTDHPDDLRGPTSHSFALYTSPRNDAGYGHTAAIGSICIASKDPSMETSLKDGLWFDSEYAGTNSILAPYLRSGAVNVNTIFKKVVAISVELASLGVFAEYHRMLIWRRIFKGAMYTKYMNGSKVAPHFSNNCPYDLKSVFKGSNPISGDGLLSTLATPTINVWQELIDLDMIKLQFPDLVKTFSVFASGILIPSPNNNAAIDIPGTRTVTMLGHVISSGGSGPVPPNLRLESSSFKEIKSRLFCGEFYGGLQISSCEGDGDRCVIMNGLMFQESNGKVSVVRDVRESPTMIVIAEHLTDIQFALIAAEARLNFLLANPNRQGQSLHLVKRFLLWLAGVAGSHDQYQDSQLVALEARAMYLASVAANNKGVGLPVPHLRYGAYKDIVNNVQDVIRTASNELRDYQERIRVRKNEEREVDRDKALNENIIRSGKLLQDYIGKQASYQQSLADKFSNISNEKEKELDSAMKEVDNLNDCLAEQRTVVKEAVINYQEAASDWQNQEMIRATLDIASNLFSFGFTLNVPGLLFAAFTSLGETVKMIQKVVEVFDAVTKTYRSVEALPSNPEKVVSALKDIGPNGLAMPSSLEWDEMKVSFDATLSTGPAIGEKNSLSAAFAVLVLRGKMLLQAQQNVQEIAADLSTAQQRLTLQKDQKKRLDDLKANLNAKPEELDVSKIDLIGLSSQLIFFERQMLMTLASTLVIQDRALQYEYLRPPTPIGSFTMLDLQHTIFNQSQSVNKGLKAQPLPTDQVDPISYQIHGVNPESIINGKHFTFNIPFNAREFASYNYVRVKSVTVEIGGITSTKSGKYYTELVFNGNPFYDRGFNREILTYRSMSRIFPEKHDVRSSSHMMSDERNAEESPHAFIATTGQNTFDGKISSITPFSAWDVSLPKTLSNEDIQFDNSSCGVTVRLIFRIYAQLKETLISGLQSHQMSRHSLPFGVCGRVAASSAIMKCNDDDAITLHSDMPVCSQGKTSAFRMEDISVENVLRTMSGKSVCAGWDIVFSMTAEGVNDQLHRQYIDRVGNSQFMRETGDIIFEKKTSEGVTTKTVFNLKFNAPRLQFLLNNSNSAQITLPIQSGHYEYSIFENNVWTTYANVEVKETDKSCIQGTLPLAVMPGSSQKKVVIKLNGGAFVTKNFEAGIKNPNIGLALTNYFTTLKNGYEVYNLGILDFHGITTLKSMKPTDFKFNVYHTDSNRALLQLFIATTGRLQSDPMLNLQEPIPSEYETSLIINSKIFFQDVLPSILHNDFTLEGTEPADNYNKDKSWSSKVTAGSISAPYPESIVKSHSSYDYYIGVDNDTVVVDLTGMEFVAGDYTSQWNTRMIYDVGVRSYDFKFGWRRKPDVFPKGTLRDEHQYSLKAKICMSSSLPFQFIASGKKQKVEIAATPSCVNLDGNLEPPAGACQSNDRDLQKMFLDNLENIRPTLVNIFNQPFDSVSLFALNNLLFPGSNAINISEVFVPGDMVVFGNFN
uniref:uncharacterized protein n=1 Tax=Myxine glutinosa TaxID=7769 RepID=UPI00358F5283